MMAMDQASMARILQAENARNSAQVEMDVQMAESNHMQAMQVQHDQAAFYAATQHMPFNNQHMEYNFAAHQTQSQPQAVMSAMPQMQDFDTTKKPRLSSGQANENELKDMLDKNLSRNLDEVANEVIANERTTSAEKTKQLFAMLWSVQRLIPRPSACPRL
jgi:hypothetical protein